MTEPRTIGEGPAYPTVHHLDTPLHLAPPLGEQADELPCKYECSQEPSDRACAPDQLVESPDDERALTDTRKGCNPSRP